MAVPHSASGVLWSTKRTPNKKKFNKNSVFITFSKQKKKRVLLVTLPSRSNKIRKRRVHDCPFHSPSTGNDGKVCVPRDIKRWPRDPNEMTSCRVKSLWNGHCLFRMTVSVYYPLHAAVVFELIFRYLPNYLLKSFLPSLSGKLTRHLECISEFERSVHIPVVISIRAINLISTII
jgi:hypothetical protein